MHIQNFKYFPLLRKSLKNTPRAVRIVNKNMFHQYNPFHFDIYCLGSPRGHNLETTPIQRCFNIVCLLGK